MDKKRPTTVNPCILIPAYNNPRTIEAVVRGALAIIPHVLVVDDGSTDATADTLTALAAPLGEGPVVVRHERNRGKGAALLTGLREAARLGFSHAIAMDADGQHRAEDLASFIEAATASPEALILGARNLEAAGAGLGSRFGRANSNFWTLVETGLRLPDTQTGFRCYPLASVLALHLRATGYDFEIEVLVKAAWAGIPVESIPIRVLYSAARSACRISGRSGISSASAG